MVCGWLVGLWLWLVSRAKHNALNNAHHPHAPPRLSLILTIMSVDDVDPDAGVVGGAARFDILNGDQCAAQRQARQTLRQASRNQQQRRLVTTTATKTILM